MQKPSDRELGVRSNITRRDFLNASLIGAGAALLNAAAPRPLLAQAEPFDGPSGIGDYAHSNGNTEAVLRVGHGLRDGKYDAMLASPIDTGEFYDLVVVGGGFSGLAAAYEFKQHKGSKQTCLIFDNHPIFGGEAKQNEFMVNGQLAVGPQGSNGTLVPRAQAVRSAFDFDGDFYAMHSAAYDFTNSLGMPTNFEFQSWDPSLKPLEFARDNYEYYLWEDRSPSLGYFFDGRGWMHNIWANDLQGTPFPAHVKKDLLAWRSTTKRYYPGKDFPKWLDGMNYRTYIEKVMGLSPAVTRYADPILAAAVGPCCDAISAYAAFRIGMPGFAGFTGGDDAQGTPMAQSEIFSFPGGNTGIARYFMKGLIPSCLSGGNNLPDVINGRVNFTALDNAHSDMRMRVGSTIIAVQHEPGPKPRAVLVSYVKSSKVYRLRARAVVMAGGSWMTRHAVTDLPPEYVAAYKQFYRSPMLVVNVALTNWRFLYNLGITACHWFGGFGFTCNIRRPMLVGDYRPPLHPDMPIVLTFYVPFYYPGLSTEEQGTQGRNELLGTSYTEYERTIRRQMLRLFSSGGFDPRTDIAGIILNRWGHAFVDAQPGFFFPKNGGPAPRDIVRKRFNRISFAHSELIGTQHWAGAAAEGRRAARQAFEVL